MLHFGFIYCCLVLDKSSTGFFLVLYNTNTVNGHHEAKTQIIDILCKTICHIVNRNNVKTFK